jgi:hypothetical protein
MKDALWESIMAAFNVRSFLAHNRNERRRKTILCCAISASAAIFVLCVGWEMSENACERVVPRENPSSALDRKAEVEVGTLDPDGPLSLRPALDPAPIVRC